MRRILIISSLLLSSLGCSTQWREGGSSVSESDVASYLAEAEGTQGFGAEQASDGSQVVYFADTASKQFGSVANVLSFADFSFLGFTPETSFLDFNEARVFFIQSSSGEQRLIFGLRSVGMDGFQYVSFSGSGSVTDGVFSATLSGPNGNIRVDSSDVIDGELAEVIQLKVFDAQDQYVGKVAAMIGFTR